MKLSTRVKTILLSAVAAIPLLTYEAHAQYRVGEDGRLLDANPRIGSGGYNSGRIPYTALMQGNRIVTGNVTAGREFRAGSTGAIIGGQPVLSGTNSVYTDPLELRTNVAGQDTDVFIRRSYGVTNALAGQLPNEQSVFYGRSLATRPPPGAIQQGFTGTYIAPQGVPPYAVTSPFLPQVGNQVDAPRVTLPRPGELLLPGPLDPQTNQPTYLQASPLGGVRQVRGESLLNEEAISPAWRQQQGRSIDPLRLDGGTIRGMQEELRRAGGLGEEQKEERPSGNLVPGTGNLAQPIGRPADTSATPPLTQRPLDSALTAEPNPEDVRPGVRNRFVNEVPPGRQSQQLAAMEQRLDQYYAKRLLSDQEQNAEFLRQLRARQEAEKLAQGDQGDDRLPGDTARPDYREMSRRILEMTRNGGEDATGGAGATVDGRRPSAIEKAMENLEQGRPRTAQDGGGKGGGARPPKSINTPVIRPQPAQVTSLADGIKAEGLAKVMRQAEDLMKKGRFVSALEQYALAEQVAPNNPFVWLGQAHAELGAGYYLRAAEHLRRALAGEPALMMAQYDLRTMIGQDRLEALVKDLKETAKAQEQNHGLVFLLAYLAYNTSNEQQAAVYLDLAQKRAGGNDDFYRLVRLHWNLPGGDGAILEDPRIPLSEVYKQFELGNVTRATVTDDRITGELKAPAELPGVTEPARSFQAELPAGAATGAFGKWVRENSNGATVRFETGATQPSQ